MKRIMSHTLASIIGTSALLILASSSLKAAGFDCDKAHSLQEKAICTTPHLSKLDEELNSKFMELRNKNSFRAVQADWLSSVRDRCSTIECLVSAYKKQIEYLSPAPAFEATGRNDLMPMDAGGSYTKEVDKPWKRYKLASIPSHDQQWIRFIVATSNIDGVLHAIIYSGAYSESAEDYLGTLYEYSDDRQELHVITRDQPLLVRETLTGNDKGERYAGIHDNYFFYRLRTSENLILGKSYKLGSRKEPSESSTFYQDTPDQRAFAYAQINENLNDYHDSLTLTYSSDTLRAGKESVAIEGSLPDGFGWTIANTIWNPDLPILYFDNSGSYACIWRVDLVNKILSKIVPEHEAQSARPVNINGREAVIYLEGSDLKLATDIDH